MCTNHYNFIDNYTSAVHWPGRHHVTANDKCTKLVVIRVPSKYPHAFTKYPQLFTKHLIY